MSPSFVPLSMGSLTPPPLRLSSPLRYLLSAACVKTITTFQQERNFQDRFSSPLPVEQNHPLAVLIMLNRLNYANSLRQARSLNSNQCHTNHISRRSSSNWSLKTDPPPPSHCWVFPHHELCMHKLNICDFLMSIVICRGWCYLKPVSSYLGHELRG